jgi:hypothetical protein
LVAHFYRRAFDLLRLQGALGLIATNSIGQGDTRTTGLSWICTHGGDIFAATRRVKWPGSAAVIVSIVHIFRGAYAGMRTIDGKGADVMTAFLFPTGTHEDPSRLQESMGRSFQGCVVVGMGFTFDDGDSSGTTTPIAEMKRLEALNPENKVVIFPYIGGEELNTSPTHSHGRYIVNFGDRQESECRRKWPELLSIVEMKVKPEREAALRQS